MDELDKSSGMFFSVKNWSDCKDVLESELSRFVFGYTKCELFEGFLKITITNGITEYYKYYDVDIIEYTHLDCLINIILRLYRDYVMRIYFKREGQVLLNSRKEQPQEWWR